MMAYAIESGEDVAQEIAMNVDRHIKEALDDGDVNNLRIDWDYYLDMSRAGACKVFTMRDAGKLVGYFILMLTNSPRDKRRIEAMCDGFFIEKSHRSKSSEFMKRMADVLKSMGVSETSILISNEKVAKFLSRFGFRETKKLWSLQYE